MSRLLVTLFSFLLIGTTVVVEDESWNIEADRTPSKELVYQAKESAAYAYTNAAIDMADRAVREITAG